MTLVRVVVMEFCIPANVTIAHSEICFWTRVLTPYKMISKFMNRVTHDKSYTHNRCFYHACFVLHTGTHAQVLMSELNAIGLGIIWAWRLVYKHLGFVAYLAPFSMHGLWFAIPLFMRTWAWVTVYRCCDFNSLVYYWRLESILTLLSLLWLAIFWANQIQFYEYLCLERL